MLEIIERQQGNSTLTNSKETLRNKLDIGKDIEKLRNFERQKANNTTETLRKEFSIERDKKDDGLNLVNKERSMETHNSKETRTLQPIRRNMEENDKLDLFDKEIEKDSVVKVVNIKEEKNDAKKSNSFEEEIDERLKSIERNMDYTRDNSLVEFAKKIEILNSPIEIKEMKKDITVLEITELSDNDKPDRHIKNIICYKCKEYGHTKKQCDRHNKNVKRISKLEFEKDIINVLMEIFNVKQKEIDQVMKKEELKSTNPLKINKRKRKQKDIIMKLIENLPNHHKDKKEYLLKLKDSIEIPIACIKCRKYGHHVMECEKGKKDKKDKTKEIR